MECRLAIERKLSLTTATAGMSARSRSAMVRPSAMEMPNVSKKPCVTTKLAVGGCASLSACPLDAEAHVEQTLIRQTLRDRRRSNALEPALVPQSG